MTLKRWEDPTEVMNRLQSEMDSMMRQWFGTGRAVPNAAAVWTPRADLRENENEYVIAMELPGIKPEEVEIELQGDVLTVKGERRFEDVENRKDYVRIERAYGTFSRSWGFDKPVQTDSVTAAFNNGVLTITLPKAEAAKPKKVQVVTG